MSQRLLNNTKWIWCLLAAMWGPGWNPVVSVAVNKQPPKVPGTVEAQAKFFQDFFSVQLSPYKIEFGHVCEDPNTWEQRYEKKDYKNHRDMGKVRWGDKQGGYGEHYWDLNHAGYAGNHGNNEFSDDDDGSYHEAPYNNGEYKVHDEDPYDEPSEQIPNYNTDYDAEKAAQEDINRAKRAHPKVKEDATEDVKTLNQQKPKVEEAEQNTWKTQSKIRRYKPRENLKEETTQKETENNNEKQDDSYHNQQQTEQVNQNVAKSRPEHYVPYEHGAGVRTHQQPELAPAANVPRLFLEPSTGRVVDRATGQAYILQPIVANFT